MIRIKRGPALGVAFLAFLLMGCAGPMTLREAQRRAGDRMKDYCADKKDCGPLRLAQTERFQQSWLVEFDAAASEYAVLVQDNGNAQISIWDKAPGASGR